MNYRGKILAWGVLLAGLGGAILGSRPGLAAELSMFAGGEFDHRGQGFSFLGMDLTHKVHQNVSVSGRIVPNFLAYQYHSGGSPEAEDSATRFDGERLF